MRTYLALFFIATLFTLLVTPAVTALGRHLKAYGHSRYDRELPQVPRLGGLAIFLATIATWGVLLLVPNQVRARFESEWVTTTSLLVPGVMVLILGIYDDLTGASPWLKLTVETIAAAMVWWAGFRIERLPILAYNIESPLVSFLLTCVWIVAITNSFNLIDGLDGLAAGIAFFVTLTVFVVSLIQGYHLVCVLAITLAGALLGFLHFNFPPAKIFLGDTGSLFVGFVLATLAIYTSQKSSTLVAIVVPYIAFGVPLLDTGLAVVRRFLSGKRIFEADLDHIHHRLVQQGFSARWAVLALYALAALFSLGSLLLLQTTGSRIALVAVLAGVTAWFVSRHLHYEELSGLNLYLARAAHTQHRVVANEILIRKAAKVLEDTQALEEAWRLLVQVLETLDFDFVACDLSGWEKGPAPFLPPRKCAAEKEADGFWSISFPLRAGKKTLGEMHLRRALNKERMLFQFSSLLDTLIPPFEKQLGRRYDAAGVDLALRPSM